MKPLRYRIGIRVLPYWAWTPVLAGVPLALDSRPQRRRIMQNFSRQPLPTLYCPMHGQKSRMVHPYEITTKWTLRWREYILLLDMMPYIPDYCFVAALRTTSVLYPNDA